MPGDGQRRRLVVEPCAAIGDRLREAEVEHFHRAVGTQLDVRRFQVAMNDALLVRRIECLGDLTRNRQGLGNRQGAACAMRSASVGPFDKLQHQRTQQAVRLRTRRSGADVWVIETSPACCASRSKRALRSGSAVNGCRQDLDRDIAIEPRVAGAVHLAHAAGAEQRHNLVYADLRADQVQSHIP